MPALPLFAKHFTDPSVIFISGKNAESGKVVYHLSILRD
jgi:hypothetical protein